jgi:hypothetical protein
MENSFSLIFEGGDADNVRLDLYDASQSYYGLARVLSVLGHYYLTEEIIVQAPKSSIDLYIIPPAEGSFKQTVLAGAAGGILAAPFTSFVSVMVERWFPRSDPQIEQVITLLKEQNELLRDSGQAATPGRDEVEEYLETHKTEADVLRSVTANSFKAVFRPIGRSAEIGVLTAGNQGAPVGAINQSTLKLIEADRLDPDTITILGVVNSFSRSSKTGVMFSKDVGRGFRFQVDGPDRLARQDNYSWSQFYGRPLRVTGRFVYFFDGTLKKLLIYSAEKCTDEEITAYFAGDALIP